MDEMNMVVLFAKLWGIETMSPELTLEQKAKLNQYDSQDLLELLVSWKNDYLYDDDADDLTHYFNQRLQELF